MFTIQCLIFQTLVFGLTNFKVRNIKGPLRHAGCKDEVIDILRLWQLKSKCQSNVRRR